MIEVAAIEAEDAAAVDAHNNSVELTRRTAPAEAWEW
jgi:hypothetical protein